jgi:hypothetical protein
MNSWKLKTAVIFALWAFIEMNAFADTGGEMDYACPVCGETFKSYTQTSGTTFGQNLDTRRVGAIKIPSPIHQCPKCRFVILNENFFTKEETEKIKIALKTNDIFTKEPDMPKYYYLAREAEIIGTALPTLISFFLSAVWENDKPERAGKLIDVTIKYIDKLEKTDKRYKDYQLIKLDLLRRAGHFDKATKQVEKIKNNLQSYEAPDFIEKILKLQMELIADKNRKEHRLP